ncbi:MAG: hypothetical protein EXQ96_00315, partial [Alphaproteobacteria bacterium]|nr:hypothetical protein [Alphaproteobacteria bacterium]
MRPLRRLVETITIDPARPFTAKTLIERLRAGDRCMIFPEGRITVGGALMKIYAGPAFIADRAAAPVMPVRIDGAELTRFSRLHHGQVRRRWLARIRITIGPPETLAMEADLRGRERRRYGGLVHGVAGPRPRAGDAQLQR